MRRGKYEKQREPIFNFAICLAIVLFWLVMITTYLTAGLFAKYSTQASGGDDARVITFEELTVAENGVDGSTGDTFIFAPGVNLTKDITVSFGGSEADTFVYVVLDVRGWDCDESGYGFSLKHDGKTIMNWSVDSKWSYVASEGISFEDGKPEAVNPDGMRYVYCIRLDANTVLDKQQVIQRDVGDELDKNGKIFVSADVTRADYAALAETKLDLNVTAHVVQANGFYNSEDMLTNAIEGWNSLRAKEVQP